MLKKGEKPEVAAPHFKVYSGMDLPYWKEFYLLGGRGIGGEDLREGRSPRLQQIVLNPLNWGMGSSSFGWRVESPGPKFGAASEHRPRLTGRASKRVEDPRLLTGGGAYPTTSGCPDCSRLS